MSNVLLLVLGLCLSQVWASAIPSTSDNELVDFLIKARSFDDDPARFDYCFDSYTEQLNKEYAFYDREYKACIASSDEGLKGADNETVKDKEEMFRRVDNACDGTKACATLKHATVVDELDCLEGRAKSAAYTVNGVSANATLIKDDLERNYQSIIAERDTCTLKAQQRFNRRKNFVYWLWEGCLTGK